MESYKNTFFCSGKVRTACIISHERSVSVFLFSHYCGYWFEVAESDIIYSHALIRNGFVVAAKDVFMIIACLVIYTGM